MQTTEQIRSSVNRGDTTILWQSANGRWTYMESKARWHVSNTIQHNNNGFVTHASKPPKWVLRAIAEFDHA
jgi:hypothetical protein